MSVTDIQIISALSKHIPIEILENLLNEYKTIKQQFMLCKFRPSELNAARFSECVIRIIEYLNSGTYTAFGTSINSQCIIKAASNNVGLNETIRLLIPPLSRLMLDIRNRRDVAHVGGEVSPNYSDSIFVTHCADWILTELVRHFYNCPIDEAKNIVSNINETRIPLIAEIDGFVRVQNSEMDASSKTLSILYYKHPNKVSDFDLCKWIRYQNISRFKSAILSKLDREVIIHYDQGFCTLLPKGIIYVEKNISFEILV